MRALAAIVVGIGAYRYDRAQFPLLEYASNDADEVVRYLTTCWLNSDDIELFRIKEEQAPLAALSEVFATIERQGPYDLQLLFLVGAWVSQCREGRLRDAAMLGFDQREPAGGA